MLYRVLGGKKKIPLLNLFFSIFLVNFSAIFSSFSHFFIHTSFFLLLIWI